MFKEWKKLNHYGEMIGIKRNFLELNGKYKKRMKDKLSQPIEFSRTKKKLLEALKEAGFILDKFEIKEDYDKQKIMAMIEMF